MNVNGTAERTVEETGEILEPELPGMPARPEPLWRTSDGSAEIPVRLVAVTLSGGMELAANDPGAHVLAEDLRLGRSLYLQCEGVVTKRGLASKQGAIVGQAAIAVTEVVRADEAGVLALKHKLDDLVAGHGRLGALAQDVIAGVQRYLPVLPDQDDDSPVANRVRSLLDAVSRLDLRSRAAVRMGEE